MVPRVQALLDTVTTERRQFERFSRSLDAEELTCPVSGTTWRVKDFISHVATLDAPYAGWFAEMTGAAETGLHRGSLDFDVDVYNEAAVAGYHDRGVEDILADAARGRAALGAVLERLEDAHLDATIRFGGDRKRPPVHRPLAQFLQGWTGHDAIHVADMLKALPERRTDPAIVAWLGRPAIAAVIGRYQQAMG